MPRPAPHLGTRLWPSCSTHRRIGRVGAGALVVGALGLIATVLLLRPYAPALIQARTDGRVDAHS